MHNFAVMDTARNGVIHKTIKAVEIEDKDTYFEIFKTSKNTTIATTAYNGSIHKKYPKHVETALPPLNPAKIG